MYRQKAYYPKGEVGETRIAKPGEFVTANGKSYEGPYYMANGTLIAGTSPMDTSVGNISTDVTPESHDYKAIRTNILKPATEKFTGLNKEHTGRYWELTKREYDNHILPEPIILQPQLEDYDRNVITRYFTQKRNEPITTIVEISQQQSENMNVQNKIGINFVLYKAIQLEWSLHPTDAVAHNLKSVRLAESDFPGIGAHLSNLTQFSKKDMNIQFKIDSNLYTDGSEYTDDSGRVYIGEYHIHPTKGPMEGANHVRTPHGLLSPIPQMIKKLKK